MQKFCIRHSFGTGEAHYLSAGLKWTEDFLFDRIFSPLWTFYGMIPVFTDFLITHRHTRIYRSLLCLYSGLKRSPFSFTLFLSLCSVV